MRVIQSKFTKKTRIFFQNGRGGGARHAGPGSAFGVDLGINTKLVI